MIKPSTNWSDVIKFAFERLPAKERLKVVNDLERLTRKERWQPLVQKIRQRERRHPVHQDDIDRICEEARQKVYAKRIKRRH